MDVRIGDRVLVNVAPFIGSWRRNEESVPCRVLDVEGTRLEVTPEEPYRQFSLWVEAAWIDGPAERRHEPHRQPVALGS